MNKKKSKRHNPTRSEYAFCWPSPRVLAVKKSHQSDQLLNSISQAHYLAKVLPTHVGQQQLFPLILKGGEKKVEIFALHLQHLYLSSWGRAAVLLPETCRENLHSLCLRWLKEQIKKGFFFFLFVLKGFCNWPHNFFISAFFCFAERIISYLFSKKWSDGRFSRFKMELWIVCQD